MAEELMFKCLSALLLPDQSIRQAAEQQLNELSSQSGRLLIISIGND
jgi:hypothetical protein